MVLRYVLTMVAEGNKTQYECVLIGSAQQYPYRVCRSTSVLRSQIIGIQQRYRVYADQRQYLQQHRHRIYADHRKHTTTIAS